MNIQGIIKAMQEQYINHTKVVNDSYCNGFLAAIEVIKGYTTTTSEEMQQEERICETCIEYKNVWSLHSPCDCCELYSEWKPKPRTDKPTQTQEWVQEKLQIIEPIGENIDLFSVRVKNCIDHNSDGIQILFEKLADLTKQIEEIKEKRMEKIDFTEVYEKETGLPAYEFMQNRATSEYTEWLESKLQIAINALEVIEEFRVFKKVHNREQMYNAITFCSRQAEEALSNILEGNQPDQKGETK